MKNLEFQCCFCGEGIGTSEEKRHTLDPCALILIANWQQPESEQAEQQFFCHLSCFKKLMWLNVPIEVESLVGTQN
jgi:hypothetical protein